MVAELVDKAEPAPYRPDCILSRQAYPCGGAAGIVRSFPACGWLRQEMGAACGQQKSPPDFRRAGFRVSKDAAGKTRLVERRRIELPTSALRTQRSPS